MRRLKTVRRPPIYPKTPGHLPCSSLTHPLPLSSRRPSVSFGGFGLRSSVRVRLVQHESDDSIIPSLEPSSRRVEDRTLNRADEHVLKHRVIRDEDVRRSPLHVPPAEHLRSPNGRPVAGAAQLVSEALPLFL